MRIYKSILILIILQFLIYCKVKKNANYPNDYKINSNFNKKNKEITSDTTSQKKIIEFCYSNDTVNQYLTITFEDKYPISNIPEILSYELTLEDLINKHSNKSFKGKVKLYSENETFLDNDNFENGDFNAADYIDSTIRPIKIRIDIDKFNACIIYIDSTNFDSDMLYYNKHLSTYPNYHILRKRNCNPPR